MMKINRIRTNNQNVLLPATAISNKKILVASNQAIRAQPWEIAAKNFFMRKPFHQEQGLSMINP